MKAIIRNGFIKRLGSSFAALGVVSSSIAAPYALAQSAPQGEIAIPDNVQLFGNSNPNVRRATAVVNGTVITGTDVDQRLALVLAANQGKIDGEEKSRLRLQVLRNLIDETLEIQEAKAANIEASQDEVDQAYARVAAQNFKSEVSAMDAYLKRVGSSPASLKQQIRGELSWQRLLQRNIAPFINVSEDEVKELLERMKAAKGTEEYHLAEIYLAAPAETQDQVRKNAEQIISQLKEGGSFVAYARQYSQASTAAVGGDLGWIRLAQLPTELATVAQQMQPNQLVGPVPIPGGFSILLLVDKRQVLTADPRDAVLALKQISINFPAGTTEAQASAKAKTFADTMKTAKGCGDVERVASSIGATVVSNDQVKARDLPAQLQSSLLNLSIGETSPPFGSISEGVRMLMLCGRDDPQADSGPSFDQLLSQMEDDRINKRAQAYMRDLRRDAVVEYN